MSVFIILRIKVTNPEDYVTYATQTEALAAKAGGRFIVKGGDYLMIEGTDPEIRLAIIQFPSREAALGWYNSADYQRVVPIAHSASQREMMMVDGVF